MPLTVTERASTMLKRLLDSWIHERGQVVRLVSDPEGDPHGEMGFELDTWREGDQLVKHERTTVMVIERSLSERLGRFGITLDVVRPRQADGTPGNSLTLLRDLPPLAGQPPRRLVDRGRQAAPRDPDRSWAARPRGL